MDFKSIKKCNDLEKKYVNKKRLTYFKKKIKFLSIKLNKTIKNIKKNKKVIHVCGASTKGNITLQYSKINNKQINFAADRNPTKWNRKMPGTNIPIISENSSRALNPDYYLVLPWHFKKEFIEREKKFLVNGGKFIFPLPDVQIVSKSNLY
jgi:NDP-4-keto-2,6-dideoxyhexose 3-C-methyltransferase